ncbi:hypothetical protein UFOVP366_49 [uncultured Caudovirales phage]|uniref:Gene product 88 domain-containing protein n=1 Tax=uncultured Caudovirales phage TaxID=2100421 RepID=A0A6J7X753_9CAUD|nr:hypothetical protein UFOVP366_49 [uncultured Caudovirales phage]
MLHHDAKTAPAVAINEKGGASALVPNAFPLPVGPLELGGSCDAVTSACVDCYAGGLEARAPQYGAGAGVNLANLHHLKACGGQSSVSSALWAIVQHSENAQRARGVVSPCFRWHSGGDIFATWYGRAIRSAVVATSSVDHWIYTRDAVKVKSLFPAPDNLRVFLSADSENVAKMARAGHKLGLPLAMLADDQAHAVALWARAVAVAPVVSPIVCPVSGKWARDGLGVSSHVAGVDGRRASVARGSLGVGACVACGVCLPGGRVRGVTFLLHGGKNTGKTAGRLGAAVRRRSIPLAVGS